MGFSVLLNKEADKTQLHSPLILESLCSFK